MLVIILKMRLLNQFILCVFLEHKLYLRAHEHLPNALPSLHNRYRVSQLPPPALFWDRSYIVLHLRSRIHPKPMIRSSLITFSTVTHFFTTLSTFLAQRLISRRHKNWNVTERKHSCTNGKSKMADNYEVQIKTHIQTLDTYNFSPSSPALLVAMKRNFDLNSGSQCFVGNVSRNEQ